MRLLWLFAHGDVAERRGSHVVRLALADKRIVFDQELDLRIVGVGVLAENFFCFSAVFVSFSCLYKEVWERAYSEISSNFISAFRVSLAALASSGPSRRVGPVSLALYIRICLGRHTSYGHQLAAMLIIQAMRALSC